jgi:hypothetical protein
MVQQTPAPSAPVVALRASNTRPFIGQELQIELDLTLPPSADAAAPLTLTVPWLQRGQLDYQWSTPVEEWLRQQRSSRSPTGVSLNLDSHRIFARRIDTATSRLSWRLVPQGPIGADGIRFPPVTLTGPFGSVRSNALVIEPRQVPTPRQVLPKLYLGVGDYHLESRVEPSTISAGDDTVLTVELRGSGALNLVPRPALVGQPGWDGDSVLVENIGEFWIDGRGVRGIRYRLRPRRISGGDLKLADVVYACFDPQQETYVTRVVQMPTVHIRVSPSAAPHAGRSAPAEVVDRLQLAASGQSLLKPNDVRAVVLFAAVSAPVAVVLGLLVARWFRLRGGWARPPSAAAQEALALLRGPPDQESANRASLAVATYIHLRGRAPVEPTWAEAVQALERWRVPDDVRHRAHEFFGRCEAERFAPGGGAAPDLKAAAARLIKDLEKVAW